MTERPEYERPEFPDLESVEAAGLDGTTLELGRPVTWEELEIARELRAWANTPAPVEGLTDDE